MDPLSKVFFIFWKVLGGAGAAFFYFTKNAALKRKAYPAFIVATAALFSGFAIFKMGLHGSFVYVFVASIFLITYLNLTRVKFCGTCGRTNRGQFFAVPKHCSHCGASLEG